MPKPKSNPLFLTIPQTSAEYGLSESTWWELIKNGKIRCFRPADVRRTLLHRYDVMAYLSGGQSTGMLKGGESKRCL